MAKTATLKGEFKGVTLTRAENGALTVDVSALNGVDVTIITNGDGRVVKQTNAPDVIFSSIDSKAFQLGHVFKAQELPENKQHLAGGLYYKDNPDGTMRVVSAEQFDGVDTWHALGKKVDAINAKGHNVRKGTKDDWDTLLASDFVESAGFDMTGPSPYGSYWESTENNPYYPYLARVRYPVDGSGYGYWRHKDNEARGRFFSDEPKFQLV